PPPLPPSEREQKVRSAIQTIQEMCTMMRQDRVEAHEFAQRFGTITFDSQVEMGYAGDLSFRMHNPVFQDSNDADIEADGEWDVWYVSFASAESGFFTIADLEPAFGPARIADPDSESLSVYFLWEPPGPGPGPVHCRLSALVKFLDLVVPLDARYTVVPPQYDHSTMHLVSFDLYRGTEEDIGGVLIFPPSGKPASTTAPAAMRNQTQR
ncbi:MAG TPA: hypothetical protein VH877_00405, partial [Polyangia bacterium]|nr:hypothetical protein [Polyangia bacterium]